MIICQLNPAGQKLDIHHLGTSGLFSLERRRREALCLALRIWRHCHNIDVKLIPLLNAADQLPTECKNHSDTTDYCHIVTCHRVITHGAEELCMLSSLCCYHDNMTLICSDQLVPDIGEHCTLPRPRPALRLHN